MPDNIASQHQEYTIDENGLEDDEEEEYDQEQESRVINQTMNRTIVSDSKARKKFLQTFKPEVVSIGEVTIDGASTVVPVNE